MMSAASCASRARCSLVAADRAAGQGQDRHRVAGRAVRGQRPAGADLHVVGVRADGEHRLPALGPGRAARRDQLGRLGEQVLAR